MPQETFIPEIDGSSTHLDARNVINNNANDAESRISNLETRLDLEPHDINSSYGEGETFYCGGSSYRVNDGATLNVGESPTTNPEKVTLLDNAGVDGASAYEVAVNEGFVGTEAEWLASLVGADGAAGADGADNATLNSVTTNGATTTNDIEVGGFKMPTGAVDTYVLTTDGNGVGTWQAAAGGPAGPSGTVLSGTTANATPTEIFIDGTSPNRVDVATGSTITFSALVAARSATESAGYKIEGVIKNDAGTAALVGVVAKTVFAEEDIAWDITVTAANNALTFIVTGDSADSVSWEVTLNKTEAT